MSRVPIEGQALRDRIRELEAEVERLRSRPCGVCGHELGRHDPEDHRCDAPAEHGIGPCPCGRTVTVAEVERLRNSANLCAKGELHAEVERLREALDVELTHGGIYDELAQVATILGCGDDQQRKMGERIDTIRDAFRDRATAALLLGDES